jgi:hypothetical protein
MNEHRSVCKQIKILAVIPVSVTHHSDVDVRRGQPSFLESVQESGAPSRVTNVHENPFLTLNENTAAKPDNANVCPHWIPLK